MSEEGVSSSGEGQDNRRRKYLPQELMQQLYDDVLRLYGEGFGHRRIVRELRKRYGVAPSRSTISYWIRGIHAPRGSERPAVSVRRPAQKIIVSLEPSPDFAYVIGAVLGDGYASNSKDGKCIRLAAKDKEFVEEFARCSASVLGRPVKEVQFWKARGLFKVKVYSATLYNLLKKPVDLERLKPFVEHCEECMAAFLRGFVDSEGSVSEDGVIYIYNTDKELLNYAKELLKRLGIEATGPYLHLRAGEPFYDPKTGKMYKTRKDVYKLRIPARSACVFYQKVGLTIVRKRRKLERYLRKRSPTPFSLLLFMPPLKGMIMGPLLFIFAEKYASTIYISAERYLLGR